MIKSGIVHEVEIPAYLAMLEKILRLRDSTLADLIVTLIAAFPFVFFLFTSHNLTTPETA